MKKPRGVTKEQWATYTGHIAFALERMNKCLDLIADANFQAGEIVERERIIKLLKENTGCGYEHQEIEKCFCDAIALIKGKQK